MALIVVRAGPDLAVQGDDRLHDAPPGLGLLLGSALLFVLPGRHVGERTCSSKS
jgi:hypothetical protein